MKRDQSVAIDAMDVSNISLQDYAVKVDYLPRDVTAEELGTFFSKFGKVHQVTLGTDVSGVIGKHRRRGEMVNTREELGAKFAKSRGKNFIVGEQIRVHDKAMQQLEKALVEATNNARAERGNRVTRCGAFPITTHRLCDCPYETLTTFLFAIRHRARHGGDVRRRAREFGQHRRGASRGVWRNQHQPGTP